MTDTTRDLIQRLIAEALDYLDQSEPEGLTLDCDDIDVPSWYRGDDFHVYKEGYASGWSDAVIAADRARWGRPAVEPVPVPVSERLPGPEDCYRGCCWLWTSVDGLGRWEVQHRDWASAPESDYTHWLSYYALPIPTTPTDDN